MGAASHGLCHRIGPPRPFCSRARVDRAMVDAPYRWHHENLAGVDVLPNNPPWQFLQNNLSSWAPPAMVSTAAYGPSAAIDRAKGNALYCQCHEKGAGRLLEGEGRRKHGKGWRNGYTTARDSAALWRWTAQRGVRRQLLEGKGRRKRGKGRHDGYRTARDASAAFVCRESDLSSF